MIIGEKIKKVRTEQGLSELAFAKKIGLPNAQSIINLEKEEFIPFSKLEEIADALKIDVSVFIPNINPQTNKEIIEILRGNMKIESEIEKLIIKIDKIANRIK